MKRILLKQKHRFRRRSAALVILAITFAGLNLHAAKVTAKEAGIIADNWYGGLIKRDTSLTAQQRQTLLDDLTKRTLRAICADGELRKPSASCDAMAYVATYIPAGFVIVAGDDSDEAILGYSGNNHFKWDDIEHNAMRGMLTSALRVKRQVRVDAAKSAAASNAPAPPPAAPHVSWRLVRQSEQSGKKHLSIKEYFTRPDSASTAPSSAAASDALLPASPYPDGVTEVLWATPEWNQVDLYNDEVSAAYIGYLGGAGDIDKIPTGCGATALAMIARTHGWPATFDADGSRRYRGDGVHSYDDQSGAYQNNDHTVDYNLDYPSYPSDPSNISLKKWPLWTDMSYKDLDVFDDDALFSVQMLMYDMGVLIETDYEIGGSSSSDLDLALLDHMNYTAGSRWDLEDPADLVDGIAEIRTSVLMGLPVIAGTATWENGVKVDPREGHWVVVSGYQGSASSGMFYFNFGWSGDTSGWFADTVLSRIPRDHIPDETYQLDLIWAYYQPYNYVYVDVDSSVLIKTGVARKPYKAIPAASSMTMHGSLWLKADEDKAYTLSQYPWDFKNVTIRAYQGSDIGHLGQVDSA